MVEMIARRTLVLFPGALGDFICFLPTLEFLAGRSGVDLLARGDMTDLMPAGVRLRSLECHGIHRLFVPGVTADQQLARLFDGYTCVHSWTGSGHADFIRFFEDRGARAHVYPARPRDAESHQIDYYLSCVGAPRSFATPRIVPKSELVAWSQWYWQERALVGTPVLALAPGSGAREKNWPVSHFRDVTDWWRQRTGGRAVVMLGPVEEERGSWRLLTEGNVVARNLSLGQAAALMVRSSLYLGNDSGMTHLAAALGVRTVALFGPSSVQQWAPRGPHVTIVNRRAHCSPCSMRTMKSCLHHQCLTTLSAEEVIGTLQGLPEVSALTRGGVEFRLTRQNV